MGWIFTAVTPKIRGMRCSGIGRTLGSAHAYIHDHRARVHRHASARLSADQHRVHHPTVNVPRGQHVLGTSCAWDAVTITIGPDVQTFDDSARRRRSHMNALTGCYVFNPDAISSPEPGGQLDEQYKRCRDRLRVRHRDAVHDSGPRPDVGRRLLVNRRHRSSPRRFVQFG